jgi:hypothetical protein
MLGRKNIFKHVMHLSLMASVGLAALLSLAQPGAALAATAPPLGTAADFAVLAGSTVTNTGSCVISSGNVGVSPGSAVTGFPPGIVSSPYTIHAADAVAAQAQIDLTTAYNNLAGKACNTTLTGQNLGGMTLTPGVYCFSTSAQLTGTLTLDALGDSNAVFVFQIGTTLTTATNSSVSLINGALSRNVFWQVGSSATLGTTTTFEGDILALTSITLNTGANMSGRALARNGAVTLDGNGVSVPCPLITLLPVPPLPQGTVGNAYSQTITASGGTAPYTFSLTAGTLPNGLSLSTGGILSGTPTTSGTFTFTVTATDALLCTGSQAYTIVINAATCPTITLSPAPPLPQGIVGNAYSQTVTASGGTAPYTFSLTAGTLPNGLSFTSGVISGTPTTAGTSTFTVTATDANGCTGLQAYTIAINVATCPTITLTPPPLSSGTIGTSYNQTITASGGTAPYTFNLTAGTLPNGLSFANGVISGTPTKAGTFTFTVTATDANGCTGLQAYTVTVATVIAAVTPVPTLSEWGMIIFMVIGGLMSIYYLRKQRR